MTKYYELNLNCARVKDMSPYCNECGFIKVLPLKGETIRRGLFGTKEVEVIEYIRPYYIMAKVEDDHFVDTILGKRITYDPDGLKDITTASAQELEQNLYKGLSCSRFREVEEEVALYYTNKIMLDGNTLNKYISELNEIERKENVINELIKRIEIEEQTTAAVSGNKIKVKLKSLIKSA